MYLDETHVENYDLRPNATFFVEDFLSTLLRTFALPARPRFDKYDLRGHKKGLVISNGGWDVATADPFKCDGSSMFNKNCIPPISDCTLMHSQIVQWRIYPWLLDLLS